ncbi:peptidoglycan-binding domain-containing protein [Aquimarina algiphila]|uniref:peptidoglycan-binding domain-containing protein n=1 Tax=Aquimarina algiphila TaxID=2047982 RepID=UPI0024915E25|nr:peptidoglycan-binding domain-containing protein [Aquimarina algiphila]
MMESKTVAKRQSKNERIQKPLSRKKVLMYSLGGGLVLGLGYLAYTYFSNRAANQRSIQKPIPPITPGTIVTKPILPRGSSDKFPLKRGTRGSLVKMVQEALLAKGGKPALIIKETSFRNGKVDGVFGKGTERALRAAGFSSVITQSQFTSLVGERGNSPFEGWGAIANEIIGAANKQNLFGVLNGLKKISSVSQYKMVSTFFQNVRILSTRVTSLVNALLSVAFKNKELEKVKIRAEFRRMGLKQNTRGVWFIPGIGTIGSFDSTENQITQEWNLAVIERPTLLQATDGSFIVPELAPDTVVGYITGMENGRTRILTQSGETVFAPTANLSSL